MYYAPHRLFKRIDTEERDSLNRVISKSEEWVYVGSCRCDDSATQKFEDNNGRVYISKYKIVCDRHDIKENDYVRCLMQDTDEVRGEGRVLNAPRCNYLNYMVIYV